MKHLYTKITPNSLLLTPNRRLSLNLRNEYDNWNSEQNRDAWHSINIIPIQKWFELVYKTNFNKILLNEHQELELWSKIITSSKFNNPLLNLSSVAREAKQAWHLLQQWLIDYNSLDPMTDDIATFKLWAKSFQQRCDTNNLIDTSSANRSILAKIDNIDLPKKIYFIGFDQLPPYQEHLIKILKNKKCVIEFYEPSFQRAKSQKVAVCNNEQEIIAMASWCKQQLQKNVTLKIGCVVPNLTTIRDNIEYHFNHICPNNFDISAGKPLASFPMINAALQLLELGREQLPLFTLSRLIRGPFISDAEAEFLQRSCLSAKLISLGEFSINYQTLLKHTKEEKESHYCPLLAEKLEEYQLNLAAEFRTPHTPSDWTNIFANLLQLFGWPNLNQTESSQQQMIERWQKLLDEFGSLTLTTTKPMNYLTALGQLQQIATRTLFQTKQDSKPITILGFLEAAGLNFDYLWIMGMNDVSWPTPAKPNHFIPKQLQKQHAMPHSTAERELQFCQELTERFNRSCQHLIYSYSSDDANTPAQPSPLISGYSEITLEELKLNSEELLSKPKLVTSQFEFLVDNYGPPLFDGESVRGGSKIYELQAACPFRGFIECRLGTRTVDPPQIGFTAIERGILTHAMLETAWQKLLSHENLLNYTDAKLNDLAEKCVNQSMQHLKSHKLATKKQFTHLEKKRLKTLLLDWLAFEKRRGSFSVFAHEHRITHQINNSKMELRVDRIDSIANNMQLIIDYKTGIKSKSSWFGERPDDPQLPLYCLSSPSPIKGIAYAQVRKGKFKFDGVAAQECNIRGVESRNDWKQLLAEWKQIISKLESDFSSGVALVDPKKDKQTCRTCAFKAICRINDEITKK